MSDVYAMGGDVLLALAIAGMPRDLPPEIVGAIFQGGADTVAAAGGVLAGGHTVADAEPKYGLCVTGIVHPNKVLTKGGAQPGDVLVLTKPLGTGAVTTALKNNAAVIEHVDAAVTSMRKLNRTAAQALQKSGTNACTDITGFGLLGHASEMAASSAARLRFYLNTLPLLPGAYDYTQAGHIPGGAGRNKDYLVGSSKMSEVEITFEQDLDSTLLDLCFDPQTSGGLFAAVPVENLPLLLAECERTDQPCWIVGDVLSGSGIEIVADGSAY